MSRSDARISALSLAVAVLASLACAGLAAAQDATPARRHFILLLDDSGDSPLRPSSRADPAAIIAAGLFAPIDGEAGFDRTRDHLSVVFFQVLGTRPAGCFADRPVRSLMPEGMFELVRVPLAAQADHAGLAAYLRSAFAETVANGGCRFAPGGYSPIARSQRLVIPYVNRHDRPAVPVSKIYLIQASNRTANPLGDPRVTGGSTPFVAQSASDELHRQIDDVLSLKPIDSRGAVEGLFVDRFRVSGSGEQASAELVSVRSVIELRRRAMSGEKIRLDAEDGSIRLRSSPRLVPIRLTLQTASTPPRVRTIDVERCAVPCTAVQQERVVDLPRAILPATEIDSRAVLAPLAVLVTTRSRYVMPGIYDALVVDSKPRLVHVRPERPVTIPRSFPVRRAITIDNRVLAGEWQPGDVNGLDQETAARRIAARRSTRGTTIVLVVLFAGIASAYFVMTHRDFSPALDLTRKTARIDFNSEIPARIDAIQVAIFNAAPHAQFRPLQRNATGPWTLTLDENVSVTWAESGETLEGADVTRLVSLMVDNGRTPTREITGRGESSAGIALDGGQLAAILPPPLWDGGPATVRLSGSLHLTYRHASKQYRWRHEVAVIPERTAAPHLIPHVVPTAEWKAGEDLDLGGVVLASASRYRFAVPARVRHVFEVAHADRVLHSAEQTAVVEGNQHIALPLIAPDGATANPTYLEEPWTVRLYRDNQQPAEYEVRVRKDVRGPEPHIVITCGTGSDPVEITWSSGDIHARQGGRPLESDSGGTIRVAATGPTVKVTRHDIPVVLCTARFSLGKPSLGGEFTAELEAAVTIGTTTGIPASVKVNGARPEAGEKTFVVTSGMPQEARIRISHRDAFNVLQERESVQELTELTLDVGVTITENGEATKRSCRLVLGQQLARHEEGTILAIDFGNSAIAVATLVPGADQAEITNLQNVEVLPGRTLAQEDPESPERGSPLIPSAFTIEFDRRGPSNGGRPGTHCGPPPERLDGSDPRTISLPAVSSHYSQYPERVVQSIKHMLASHYDEIALDSPIRARQWTLYGFKVDKLLIGVMRALAGTYTGANTVERLVYTVPNTLLPWQERRVRAAIESAFTSAKPQWTRSLSESDAVMYWYLEKLPSNHRQELILFYDFGSGTIDLTLARVTVDAGGTSAEIIARIGLDRAGAYLDQAVTSIVHEKLEQALHDVPDAYRYPLLGSRLTPGVTNFASELAWAKKNWTAGDPLRISQHVDHTSVVDPSAWPVLASAGLMSLIERRGTAVKSISVDWNTIHRDARVDRFFEFIRNELVTECLRTAGVDRQQITSVVISGRGALWPGFVDTMKSAFAASVPVAQVSPDAEDMKLAVVRGAASWLQNRHSIRVSSSAPGSTYLAFTDLDKRDGTWRQVVTLGLDRVPLPAGALTLAAIDFRYDERTIANMLRHPVGKLLVRILPANVPVSADRDVKAFLTVDDGRTTINIDDGFLSEVVIGGGKWQVGDWSAWNQNQLGGDA